MDSKKLALRCGKLADDKKAEDIVVLDMRRLTTVADYFVVCTGTSEPHLRAILDELTDKLREESSLRPRAIDGALATAWVVLDYSDVIVHIMRREQRERYNLEGLWGDAPRVSLRAIAKPAVARVSQKRPAKARQRKLAAEQTEVREPGTEP